MAKKSKEQVEEMMSGAGWVMDFASQLNKRLRAAGKTPQEIHALVTRDGEEDMQRLVDAVVASMIPLDPRLLHSQKLWAKLGVAVEVDDLEIPDLPQGLTEIAIIPAHLSNEELFALCKKHMGDAWKYYDNLDDVKVEQARPKRTYVIGYRDGKEPDTVHLEKSYDVATKEGLIFMTLKEYQCVALLHFAATTGHLDEKGRTITSSVASVGYAFIADWYPDDREFRVHGGLRSYSSPSAGPRQAVFA